MKPRRLILWNSEDSCRQWHKDRETPDFAVEEWVKRSMTYGNFLPVETVKKIVESYDVRVVGGV